MFVCVVERPVVAKGGDVRWEPKELANAQSVEPRPLGRLMYLPAPSMDPSTIDLLTRSP